MSLRVLAGRFHQGWNSTDIAKTIPFHVTVLVQAANTYVADERPL